MLSDDEKDLLAAHLKRLTVITGPRIEDEFTDAPDTFDIDRRCDFCDLFTAPNPKVGKESLCDECGYDYNHDVREIVGYQSDEIESLKSRYEETHTALINANRSAREKEIEVVGLVAGLNAQVKASDENAAMWKRLYEGLNPLETDKKSAASLLLPSARAVLRENNNKLGQEMALSEPGRIALVTAKLERLCLDASEEMDDDGIPYPKDCDIDARFN